MVKEWVSNGGTYDTNGGTYDTFAWSKMSSSAPEIMSYWGWIMSNIWIKSGTCCLYPYVYMYDYQVAQW